MLFSSFSFLLFFPLVFILYWFVFNKNKNHQNALLLIASYFFYGFWSWKFILLLIFSTLLDYAYGFGVRSTNQKKAKLFLWLSIINNLGILFIFKYFNFFSDELNEALGLLGIHANPLILNVVLPVGISFYTFHGMSYIFDIYRRLRKPVHNFLEYSVFVCFFPLLVAGPIERANHFLPQIQSSRSFNYTQSVQGCRLILWGFFKKIVIADNLALLVDEIFGSYTTHNSFTLILGAIGFSFQIYADFSGYSDIAIGSSKLLGFELLSNFRFPYFSRNIAEFWRKWHISLTTWFRDYLYIPMGGSKKGNAIAIRNTFIIFLVSGFWHGASWNFIAWGAIHALAFLPLLLLNRNRLYVDTVVANNHFFPTLKELVQITTTFTLVTFAWIFFRLHDIKNAIAYITRIIFNHENPAEFHFYMGIVFLSALFVIIDWYLRKDERNLRVPRNIFIRYAVYIVLAFTVYFFWGKTNSSFIYFQF